MTIWQRRAASWSARFSLAVAGLFAIVAVSHAGAINRTNNNSSGVDAQFVSRTVNIGAGAVGPGELITEVFITVSFEKIDGGTTSGLPEPGACAQVGGAGHQGGFAWNPEIHMTLISPKGTRVVLIEDDINTGGSGVSATYTDIDYTGPATVTFREGAFPLIGGPGPTSGTFLPEEVLFAFNGESPVGQWTLEMSDNFPEDPLCFGSYTLTVNTSDVYQIGPEMSASFFDPNFLGSGINTEILALPTAGKDGEKGAPGVVLVYWYSYDILGFPIFAFGVGEFNEDTMVVEMLIDYDGGGPVWGPGWNPADFEGLPFATATIVWASCGVGVMTFVLDPSFLSLNPGWVEYVLNLQRITNVVGLPPCI